jgi:hypothetical protein
LLGLIAAVARPDDKSQPKKEEPGKAEPITEEKLKGDWEGKLENGSVKVKFDAKGDRKIAVAVVVLKVDGSVTVGSVGYEIDAKNNEVKFPFAKDATAKPTKDGALMLSGQFTFGGRTYRVPETRIERVKPSEEKEAKKPDGKVYKSAAELFEGMPEDAHPKGGADATPERAAAREWMKKNRAGRDLEWTATVKDVSIDEADGRFVVRFDLDVVRCVDIQSDDRLYLYWGKPIGFGKDKCQPTIAGGYSFGPVAAATAKKLREWKGKKATFRATITAVEFEDGKNGRVINPSDLSPPPACYAIVRITPPTIDGYAPQLLTK